MLRHYKADMVASTKALFTCGDGNATFRHQNSVNFFRLMQILH
jgi:hypothetical protein